MQQYEKLGFKNYAVAVGLIATLFVLNHQLNKLLASDFGKPK
jgi:hypothetical protein